MTKSEGILRLLLVNDSLTEADNITNILRSTGYAVRATRHDTLTGIETALNNQSWDLLICKASLTAAPPEELVNYVHRLGRDLPCIVLTASHDDVESIYELAVQDVIPSSDNRHIQFAVERELQNLFMRRLARRNERALRESEKRSRLLLESSRDAVAYMHEGMHIYVNNAYLALFGFEEPEDVSGLPMLDLITVEDHAKFKTIFRQFSEQSDAKPQTVSVRCVKTDSSGFKANIEFSHAEVEGEPCTQVVVRHDDEDVDPEARIQLLRDHDFLTGLYTRARFLDELEYVVGRAGEGRGDAALLYLVIDEFQSIKEKLGLGSSDLVIKEVAELLKSVLGEKDLLARYSDQVFTIIIDSDDDTYVEQRAEKYRQAIESYVSSQLNQKIDLRCSIGVSRISEKSSTIDAVLNNADKACMQAQRNGGNQVTRFQVALIDKSEDIDEATLRKMELEEALKNDNFILYYQPIVSLHGREQELYEVLLRYKGEDGQVISAEKFIESAKQSDLMEEIDQWVILHAIKKLTEHQQHYPKTRLFIKLSAQTVCDPEFIDWLIATFKNNNIDANAFIFEMSETQAIENIAEVETMIAKIKQAGSEFALEHFGSGLDFSSTLDVLDVDYLKINGTFVKNMAKDTENQAAVKAIIEMGKNADKQTIAEFVSDASSLAALWRLGVDYAQGYYIHEPSESLDYNFEEDEL